MSKGSEERQKLKVEYFETLRDTARAVDPYVREFIDANYQTNPGLKGLLMSKYRFGKPQLRPAQVRLAYELVGGRDWKESIPACASVEAKDTGYYCFDDVLDSRVSPILIILGGVFVSISYAMINDLFTTYSPQIVQKVFKELTALDADNAQAAMIDLSLKQSNEELYMKKARGYNFWEHALRIGGIMGGASNEEVEKLGIAGQKIGIAYIIANDTWDFGKDLEDFRAGKYTLPVIWAFEHTTNQDRRTLELLIGKDVLSEEQLNEIRTIYVRSGAIIHGKKMAQELCDEGSEILNHFPDSQARRMLNFSTTMTQRNEHYNILRRYESTTKTA